MLTLFLVFSIFVVGGVSHYGAIEKFKEDCKNNYKYSYTDASGKRVEIYCEIED